MTSNAQNVKAAALNRADLCLVLSEEWKEFFSHILPEEKIFVLQNGVPVPQKGKRDYSGHRVLFLGRLCREKGIGELLEAAVQVRKAIPDFELVLGGFWEEGNGELKEKAEKYKDLLKEIKEDLGDKVKEVRLTANLKTYPACLASGGDISIEMEKVFNSMPNADGSIKADKVLEISSEHRILSRLEELYSTDKDKLKKYALVLYGGARLLEGLAPESAGEFVTALTDII